MTFLDHASVDPASAHRVFAQVSWNAPHPVRASSSGEVRDILVPPCQEPGPSHRPQEPH